MKKNTCFYIFEAKCTTEILLIYFPCSFLSIWFTLCLFLLLFTINEIFLPFLMVWMFLSLMHCPQNTFNKMCRIILYVFMVHGLWIGDYIPCKAFCILFRCLMKACCKLRKTNTEKPSLPHLKLFFHRKLDCMTDGHMNKEKAFLLHTWLCRSFFSTFSIPRFLRSLAKMLWQHMYSFVSLKKFTSCLEQLVNPLYYWLTKAGTKYFHKCKECEYLKKSITPNIIPDILLLNNIPQIFVFKKYYS